MDARTPVCRLFLEGCCKQGKRCRYRHVLDETPQPIIKKYKPFLDIAKSQQGKATHARNQILYGEGDFLGCLKRAVSPRQQELLRLIRRYQSGIDIPGDELPAALDQRIKLTLRWSPTIPRSELCLDFDIEEGYILLDIDIPETYPYQPCIFEVLNVPPRRDMSTLFNRIQCNLGKPYSAAKTLQFVDNKFDKFCQEVKAGIEIPNQNKVKSTNESNQAVQEQKQSVQVQGQTEKEQQDNNEYDDSVTDSSEEDENTQQIQQSATNVASDDHHERVIYGQVCEIQNLELEGIGVLEIQSIHLDVECKRCHLSATITVTKGDYPNNFLVNTIPCSECCVPTKTFFKTRIMHLDNPILGNFGSFQWKLKDILKCVFKPICQQCDQPLVDEECMSGIRKNTNCRNCFKKGSFIYESLSIEDMVQLEKPQPDQQEKQQQELTTYRPRKVGVFKAGMPLPADGACRHYSSSHRWFRFPCCGKAYPCDDCHWVAEKHEHEQGKNMICGFCSQEQHVRAECKRCGKTLCMGGSGNSFWEGGKGVRNRIQMSTKDGHKYAGLNKTKSKRQQQKK